MLAAEPAPAATVRFLTGGMPDPGTVLADATAQVPPGGLASPRMEGKYHLLAGTYRLLDSRILAAALTCLDQDVGQPIAERLSTFRELRAAAQETRDDPDPGREAMVTLAPGHRLASTQGTEVKVVVDGTEVAAVPFRLELSMTLGHTSAVLRHGAIQHVECVVTEVAVALSLAEPPVVLSRWATPVVTLRLPVAPPVVVPLVPTVPRPRGS